MTRVLNAAEYMATQNRVALLARVIISTDPEPIEALVAQADTAAVLGPLLDPTAWARGRDNLAMVRSHARAILEARRRLVEAAEAAGVSIPEPEPA